MARVRKLSFSLCVVLLLLGSGSGAARAQEITATVTGVVTDATGAVIAGATVAITNVGTQEQRRTTTSADGIYILTNLPVGAYRLSVEQQGFKKYVLDGIELHVNDRLTINVTLQAGAIEEVIEVTGEAPLVQTSPTIQGLISSVQVRELPLNNRNFVQLTQLIPGVTSALGNDQPFGGLAVVSISVNGGRTSGINWLIDGARNVDTGSNLTVFNYPSVDAIAEFKILTNSYSPEFGRNGAGVVNVVTRSGTADFHGAAYEFLRNDRVNARRPFQFTPPITGRSDLRPPLRYNNFGWNIGGPVILPGGYNRNRDKTFFFFSEEWRRIRSFNTPRATVPTVETRRGDFSLTGATITDPMTGQPFPNNLIPSDRINPNARIIVDKLYPLPNEGTTFFRATNPAPVNFRQELVRVDHNFTDNVKLWVRYAHDINSTVESGGLFAGTLFPNVSTTATDTPADNLKVNFTTIISPTVLNEFSYDFARNEIASDIIGQGKKDVLGLNIPEIFPGSPANLMPGISISGHSGFAFFGPFLNDNPSHTFTDNFTLTRGSHTIKAGVFLSREEKNENSGGGLTNGSFSFDGRFTGGRGNRFNALADFLLGLASSYSEDENDVTVHLRYNTYEWYIQDTWKVRPHLTIDFGVRHSMFGNPKDQDDLLIAFRPDLYDPTRAVQLDPATGQIVPDSGERFNGIIFAGQNSPFGRRVQDNHFDTFGPRLGFAWNPRGDARTVIRGGYGIYYDRSLVGIVEQNAFVNPLANTRVGLDNAQLSNPTAGTPRTAIFPISLNSTGFPFLIPTTQQWSLSIQRELFRDTLFEIAYVGSGGNHLLRLTDINQPRPLVAQQFNNRVDLARPFKGFRNINDRQTTATSRYHSLQLVFKKRFTQGLGLDAVYTWSKNITDASTDRSDRPQDSLNARLERAPSQFDRTQVFTLNYVWELPFFKGTGGVGEAILGGWELSGITSFWSGRPLSVFQSGDSLLVGGNTRPDLIADPEGPETAAQWFNTGALQRATTTFGTAGRGIFRGPGINNWDVALLKNWRFTETGRVQFRAEFFNVWNHTQFDNPNTTLGSAAFGTISGSREPRIIQFGLKVMF